MTPFVLSEFCRVEDRGWVVPTRVTAGTKMDVVASTLPRATLISVVSNCTDNLRAVLPFELFR